MGQNVKDKIYVTRGYLVDKLTFNVRNEVSMDTKIAWFV